MTGDDIARRRRGLSTRFYDLRDGFVVVRASDDFHACSPSVLEVVRDRLQSVPRDATLEAGANHVDAKIVGPDGADTVLVDLTLFLEVAPQHAPLRASQHKKGSAA